MSANKQQQGLIASIKHYNQRYPLATAIVGVALSLAVLITLGLGFLNLWTHHGANSTVPDIRNMPYAEAEALLAENDLHIEISDSIYDKSYPPGTVIESWPKAGATVKSGRDVYVSITAFSPKHVTLSNPITNVSVRQAVSILKALGINAIQFVNVPSEYPDLVENARCQGRPVGVGSVIPVDATVILEVGVPIEETGATVDSTAMPASAEDEIESELSNQSTYTDF